MTDDRWQHGVLHNGCWITKVTYTHSEYVILIVALTTATTGKNAPQRYVTFYVHCLSCYSTKPTNAQKKKQRSEWFGKNLGRLAGLQLRALPREFSRGVRNTMKNTGQDLGLLRYGSVTLAQWFLTFRWIVVTPSTRVKGTGRNFTVILRASHDSWRLRQYS